MKMSALCRQGPSWTWLPSTRTRRQSWDSAPCATIRFSAEDLPPPGSPPISMFRSARLTWTCSPYSSTPRCTGSNMENGKVGTRGSGRVSVVVMGCLLPGQMEGRPPGEVGGRRVLLGSGLPLIGGVLGRDQLELVDLSQPLER